MMRLTEIGKAIILFAILLSLCSNGWEIGCLVLGTVGLLMTVVGTLRKDQLKKQRWAKRPIAVFLRLFKSNL